MTKFNFSDVVVVDEDQIGVVVKCWADGTYDVYVRSYNGIREYKANQIDRYIFSKCLLEEQYDFYR